MRPAAAAGAGGLSRRDPRHAASADLVELVLRDSAQIQAEDVEFKKKRHRKEGRRGKFPEKPLYTMRDVERTLPLLKPVPYDQPQQINGSLSAVFHDAGHILGSAMVELTAEENGQSRRLLFSGDIGQTSKPLARARPPSRRKPISWSWNRPTATATTRTTAASRTQLAEASAQTVAAGGKVVIPIFAIERAQELVYYLGRLLRAKRIPSVPVFLDSPMAADVTEVFRRHRDCFDAGTKRQVRRRRAGAGFPRPLDRANRRAIQGDQRPQAGRRSSWPPPACARPAASSTTWRNTSAGAECTVLFVGYQAAGTLGRQILDGNREVRIHRPLAAGAGEDRADQRLLRPCRPQRLAGLAGGFHRRPKAGRSSPTAKKTRRWPWRKSFARPRAGTSSCRSISRWWN